ncbi:hypothetical protein AB0L82_43570 [Nocardia sp. NPDC052001]|uniref:DUF6630 family protein n=1 Tax=Nocardia sp. NPDC052001 TaxID=3154853 RepID=UPI00341C2520
MSEPGAVNGNQTRNGESIGSVREDMLAVAALVARNIPAVAEAVRAADENLELALVYALSEHRMVGMFDWKEDVQSVRDGLEYLVSYPPGADWSWHPDFLAETHDWPSGDTLERFLELTGECLHHRGYALVAIQTGADSYFLAVVPKVDYAARRTDRTDRWVRPVKLGTWSMGARPVADRNTVGPRATMSDWDRFIEDLTTMIECGLGGETVLEITNAGEAWAQISESCFDTLGVIPPPFAFIDDEAREMVAEGWILDDHIETGNNWQIPRANAPEVSASIASRVAAVLRRYGVNSPTELTARTWCFGQGTLPLWRMDIPITPDRTWH